MSYNSKYAGAKVEAYIDKIALGELDNVYVTEFTIDELLLVVDSNIPLSIDKDSLVNAVKANKIIAIPYNTDNNGGGCIASVEDYGDVIYFYLKNYYSSIKFFVDTNETNAEITIDYIEVVWWQEALYSGETIKTINGEDILGSGDLELATKDEVVHKEGDESISGTKTFRGSVKLLRSGDGAITIGTDTRIGVEGTTNTVLGFIRQAFIVNSKNYPLYMYGQAERPKYNDADMALLSDVSGKQDKLVSGTNIKTINGTSILGSGDIVISGGGGSSSGSGAYAEVNHGTSDTTFALTPNTFHVWDEVSALTLTLGNETAGVANEYLFQFTSGATATSLTLPDDIKWANDTAPTIAENMIYQVSILKGMASVLEFSNAVVSSIFPATLTVGDNGDLGVSVYETLYEGVVLQEGDLTLIVDGENYSITEYEFDYDYSSNGGFQLLYLEDGPMRLYYILESSGEVKLYVQ